MDLEIKDVADILNVSENTIQELLSKGEIPSYRLNQEYRFSRNEIEDWVMHNKVASKSKDSNEDSPSGKDQFSLYRALNKGGLHYDIEGDQKVSVIKNTMEKIAVNLCFDPESVSKLLMERENLMSTALNNGIAVPHTRDFLLENHQNAIATVFLDSPIEYNALDHKPVDTLFFLFASDDKQHLLLLAKLAHLCQDKEFLSLIKRKPSRSEFMGYIKSWETKL